MQMKLFLFWTLFLSSFNAIAFSQDSDSLRSPPTSTNESGLTVKEVVIRGNEQTKDFIILREMTLKPGSRITPELLDYDKNRIYSLGLFNRVELDIVPNENGLAQLVVDVSERWYIFPFPIFGIKDRDWSKLYYGIGFLHNNFRGRNEKLFGSFVLGYNPSIGFGYRNPFLAEDGSYFLEIQFGYNISRNKSIQALSGQENFDERNLGMSTTIGRRFGIAHTTWLSIGYQQVSIPDYFPNRTISPTGNDRFPVMNVGYSFDTRDLKEYPSNGTLAIVSIKKNGIPGREIDFVRYAADVRKYLPIVWSFNITGRVFTDLVAAGRTPSYNRVYFGYQERIRGHFREVMEGENIFGVTSELHYPLLSPHYYIVNFLPPEFGVWRFGITAALFGDAGMVWFRGESFAINRFTRGYGVGIHFLLPYSIVLRTEYALNEVRRGEFIVDVGAAL